jgi:transcriptional regulator with XRE-family HTH domain
MKNEILFAERQKNKMTQEEFAKFIGISKITYNSYENCTRIPRNKHMEIILNKLNIKDPAVFYPKLHIIDDESEEQQEEKVESIISNICNCMNEVSRKRTYDIYEVSMIRRAVRAEYLGRKFKKIKITKNDKTAKKKVNENTASIANGYLKADKINYKDVELFKKCKVYEYESRTLNKSGNHSSFYDELIEDRVD